ncbi:heme-binding protein 2-like [Acanthaster planci]|uniref:Heme-binding protein 2-like n=1 Tax=Acanthaster planci TaxID=133434 RepID=A0A8B7Z1M4_ACAPL|nr:heme-binding protein 2-like [Acanthaster planci]
MSNSSGPQYYRNSGAEVMGVLKGIVLFAVLAGACVARHIAAEPAFCRELECPKFTTDYTTKDYEKRTYPQSMWVSTTIIGVDYQGASTQGFDKLFEYISGKNSEKKKIDMTAPVITRVMPGQGPTCADNFTVSFMVPFELQPNPPQPTDSSVIVSTLPAHQAYVRSYPGFSNEKKFLEEAEALAKALNSSQPYQKSFYYTAGYDSPFTVLNRHNEIWFII